jgi:hypothetical protein
MTALNFPSSPTDGQVFDKFTYSSSLGLWAKSGPVLPASDNNEYVRINGVWRLKTERKSIAGSSLTNCVFTVPSGAKYGRWLGQAYPAATTAFQHYMRVHDGSAILTGATAYQVVGWLHNIGSSAYVHQAVATLPQFVLTTAHNVTNHANTIQGGFATVRNSTSQNFSGQCRSWDYNSAATNFYMHFAVRMDLAAAATSALTLTQLIFYGSASVTYSAESMIEMEWFY